MGALLRFVAAVPLVVLVGAAACAEPLDDLAPFPCAKDNTCPGGYTCIGGTCIEGLAVDTACGVGTRCANGDCIGGLCLPHCAEKAPICPTGRVCSYPEPGETGPGAYCLFDCATAGCPAGLSCEPIYNGVKACVSAAARASIDRTCDTAEACQTTYGITYLPITCARGTCVPTCSAEPAITCGDPARSCHLGEDVLVSGCVLDCTKPGTVCAEGLTCKPSPADAKISQCVNPTAP